MSSLPVRLPLADLPEGVLRGRVLEGSGRKLPTGNADLDALLGGGLPRGHLSEIVGRASSGRTSIAQALLATTTAAGETTALVDPGHHLDPRSAAGAGVLLGRLLWVRPRSVTDALRSTEALLETKGIALVVLDLADGVSPYLATKISTAWARLARKAETGGAAFLLLASDRLAGSAAALCLGLTPSRFLWPDHRLRVALFSGIESRGEIVRLRGRPPGSERRLRFSIDAVPPRCHCGDRPSPAEMGCPL